MQFKVGWAIFYGLQLLLIPILGIVAQKNTTRPPLDMVTVNQERELHKLNS